MKKYDFIIIAAVLAVAGMLLFFLYGPPSHSGAYVSVEIDGKVAEMYKLSEDRELEIKTENGTNKLVIKDGVASVTDADCPDKICVHHSAIKRNGESIICLPHKLVVTVTDSSDSNEIDFKS